MADVTGSIGNEYVELNNAATEATLRLLLQATLSANKQNLDQIKNLAKSSGLNPETVNAVNNSLKNNSAAAQNSAGLLSKLGAVTNLTGESLSRLDDAVSPLIKQMLEGTASASGLFTTLSRLPGPLGKVADLFSRLADYQEKNMKIYQELTNAGVNFGGSLTDIRQAALNTYMSLDQFSNLMKANGESFARLGGTADQGAKSFVKLSNALIQGEAGEKLLALGYTSEQVNQGLASYLTNTGARTRQEMQNTAALTASAAAYMTELDALAQITGKSRDEQEKALKQANANAAFERYKMSLGEKERRALELGLAQMSAKFGKAGEEMYIAQTLGIPPMTDASQKLTALAPAVAQASQGMVNAAKSGKDLSVIQKYSADATQGAVAAADRLGSVMGPLSFSSDSTGQALMGLTKEANRAKAQGTEQSNAEMAQRAKIAEEQKKRADSQAAEMAQVDKAMKEMGQSINNLITPVVQFLTPVLTKLTQALAGVLKAFEQMGPLLTGSILIGLTALGAYLMKLKASKVLEDGGGGSGTLRRGYSPTTPLYVQVIGPGGLGGGGGGGPTGGGPASGGGGKGGLGSKLMKGVKGFGVGSLVGIGADFAADALGRDTTAGKSADVLGTAAGWAGTGALLGSIVPGLGTTVGAVLGGALGAGYGAYQNFFAGPPKMALGGIVTQPTTVTAGEAGTEAILPLHHLESLRTELRTLNSQSAEILRYMKETADYTRQTVDATKSLNGDLFKF